MRLRFLLSAEEEMIGAAVFYEGQSVGLGADFLDDVDSAVGRICEYPKIGQIYSGELRW